MMYQACLQSDCACFQALTNLDSTCENFQTLNDDTKANVAVVGVYSKLLCVREVVTHSI